MTDNGQPPHIVGCECGCGCDSITTNVEKLCLYCQAGDHRTPRVVALERALAKAKSQITQLERMKGIQWNN